MTLTFSEAWKQMHGNCKGSYTRVNGTTVEFVCPVHNVETFEKVPYPFCRTPLKCAGVGYCRAEFACND